MHHASDVAVKEEFKIVRWVKLFRVIKHALGKLMTEQEWAQIEEEVKEGIIIYDEK